MASWPTMLRINIEITQLFVQRFLSHKKSSGGVLAEHHGQRTSTHNGTFMHNTKIYKR
uniref:Uncharacterized protein n=1 Tax=Arion vulgaris TaxID=1028688 RepID=A0A0B7ANA1_9EUPU